MIFDTSKIKIEDIISQLQRGEKAEFICEYCNQVYSRSKRELHSNRINRLNHRFCSNLCKNKSAITAIKKPCEQCGTIVVRTISQYKQSKTSHVFCNASCAAKYNNTHKTHGNRRSKLEIYLEEKINDTWPTLQCICNGKNAIQSELDFYFPQLRLAIELNGIFHYEPIYGIQKFNQIKNNDKQKFKSCIEHGIELAIIDASKCTYLTKHVKDEYWQLVKDIITPLLPRLDI